MAERTGIREVDVPARGVPAHPRPPAAVGCHGRRFRLDSPRSPAASEAADRFHLDDVVFIPIGYPVAETPHHRCGRATPDPYLAGDQLFDLGGCRVRVSHSRFRLRSPVGQQGNVAKGAGHGDLAHYFRERPWKDVPAVLLDIDQIPEQESIKVS